MRYVALEEAFVIPELAERQPMPKDGVPACRPVSGPTSSSASPRAYRLHPVPVARDGRGRHRHTGPVADGAGPAGRHRTRISSEHARFVNDYTAEVVSKNPDRFRGFAALPLQDPLARPPSWIAL